MSTISSTAETRNTKLGFAPFCVIGVPAAHGPMNGTFSWFTTGTIAIDTGVSRPPNSTATFSLKMSSRAAVTPLAGLPSSSRRTSSSGRPEHAALGVDLVDGDRSCRGVIASPARADWPDSAVTRPILIGSAASAGSGMPARTPSEQRAVRRGNAGGYEWSWRSPGGRMSGLRLRARRVRDVRRDASLLCKPHAIAGIARRATPRRLPLSPSCRQNRHTVCTRMSNMTCRQDSCSDEVRNRRLMPGSAPQMRSAAHPRGRRPGERTLTHGRCARTSASRTRRSSAARIIAGPTAPALAVYVGFNVEHFAFGEGLGAGIAAPSPQPRRPQLRRGASTAIAWACGAASTCSIALGMPIGALINTALVRPLPGGGAGLRGARRRDHRARAHQRAPAGRLGRRRASARCSRIAATRIARADRARARGLAVAVDLGERSARPDLLAEDRLRATRSTGATTTSPVRMAHAQRRDAVVDSLSAGDQRHPDDRRHGRWTRAAFARHDRRPLRRDAAADRAARSRW